MDHRSLLLFAASVLVSACAVLSALGFRGRPSVIGVDLGTTFSVVAVSGVDGEIRVVPSDEDDVLTPSTVAFAPGGRVLVGRAARRHPDARHVIYDAKRFIGRAYDDAVRRQADAYAFDVRPDRGNNDTKMNETPTQPPPACFGIDRALGHAESCVSPETIGSLVVGKLRAAAEAALGHGVRSAVICVPAGFTRPQIVATDAAFKLAGLDVARVVEEPVAAACAYGLHKRTDVRHVLVFDFGGGTLDVSVLYIQDESVEVVATAGDNDLGGTDFDRCLADEFSRRVAAAESRADPPQDLVASCPLPSAEKHQRDDDPPVVCAPHALLRLAEAVKVELSDAESATRTCLAGPSCAELRPVELTISRRDFETSLCGHLFDKALRVVREAVEEARIQIDEIDEVVLVGGTSRIPKVRAILKAELNISKLNTEIDPDVTVAVGAASILD